MKTKGMMVLPVAAMVMLAACERQGGTVGGDGDMFKLAHMNGCLECHTDTATTVGPSWQEVADRYKDAPYAEARALLIESVKKGSKGKWMTWKAPDGMPPLERRVSEEHIAQLVDHILSLNRGGAK